MRRTAFAPNKPTKRKKLRKAPKHIFGPSAKQWKAKASGHVCGVQNTQNGFSLLCQFCRSAKFSAPKAHQKWKMSTFPLFCYQKWEIVFLWFWSKKVSRTLGLYWGCYFVSISGNRGFLFMSHFSLCCYFLVFLLLRPAHQPRVLRSDRFHKVFQLMRFAGFSPTQIVKKRWF